MRRGIFPRGFFIKEWGRSACKGRTAVHGRSVDRGQGSAGGTAVTWRGERTGYRGSAYPIVSSLFSKSDFTNRMYLGVSMRTGRSQRHPCLATPEIAIRGDFTLGNQHSVSEIVDFSRRLETIGYALPLYPVRPPLHVTAVPPALPCTLSTLRPVHCCPALAG